MKEENRGCKAGESYLKIQARGGDIDYKTAIWHAWSQLDQRPGCADPLPGRDRYESSCSWYRSNKTR